MRRQHRPAAQQCPSSRHPAAALAAVGSHQCQKMVSRMVHRDTLHTMDLTRTTATTTRTTPLHRVCRPQGGRRLWVGVCARQHHLYLLMLTHRQCQTGDRHQVEAVRVVTTSNDRPCGVSSARTGYARNTNVRTHEQPGLVHSLRRSRCSGHEARANRARTSRGRRRHRFRHQRRGMDIRRMSTARVSAEAARASQRGTTAQTTRRTARRSHRSDRAIRRYRA